MFDIKIADLTIRIENQYEYIRGFCKDYIVPDAENVDFSVKAELEDIMAEQTGNYPGEYLETLAVYRKIAKKMLAYHGFLMHGVVAEFSETGISFLAKSGVGKSTHIALWKKLFGNKVTVINGDKPIIRCLNGSLLAYGTPWAGKEREQTNKSCVLKKICFLERGTENKCEKLQPGDAIMKLLQYIYTENNAALIQILTWISEVADSVEFYSLHCNMELSAAETVYRGIME